ncbi:hypothetical protein ORI20_30820 [Mycobacterium sp. CVI_P3]|uniref:ESX-1 secretion-associated protein EspA/EspE-like domain-containing protein n=1 Tax=Mycobacterium pinniadriaticum TaxID=2994102 RepID=A0ABT3SNG9_9MYCO|nr:hypothetical protein [Mycobacterium pinniadriaticum]MCX2934666.1 hypothetical protein [Mycobacterium pinniadriaticum]MCX2941088.1 hypothetical protein [Mycobacterium pinniadriaticum]
MARIRDLGRNRSADHTPPRSGPPRPEGIRLIPVDSATATARPDIIADTYLELEHHARGLEQQHLFAAEGEVKARKDASTAGALAFAVSETKASVARAKTTADAALDRHHQVRDQLGPYVRRKATSSRGYIARTAALLVGDIAGLSGATIALGEYPVLAVTQALSAGTATITAGLAATHLRHLQQAAARRQNDLPKALEPYRHLFDGPSKSTRLHAVVFAVAALIAILVAVGIFALRTAIEGPLSGMTFGGLAAAIALASFVNSWYHADAVADVIESAEHEALKADHRHRQLASGRLVHRAEQAASQEKSIITEYTHRGLAAAAHIEADKYRALLASPDVVGHGPAKQAPITLPPVKRARSA